MRIFAKLLIIISLAFPHTLHSNSNFKTCSIEFDNFSQYLEQFQPCLDSQIEDNSIILENLLKSDETAILKENFNFDSSQLDLNKDQKKLIDQLIADEYEYSYGIHSELKDLRAANSISEELYKNILTYYYDNLIDEFYELSDDYNLSVFVLLTGFLGKLFEPDDSKTVDLTLSASSIAENSSDSITVTAVANEPVAADTTVSITLGGDASSPSDYTIAATTITISSGATTGTTTISLVDDSVYEGNETVSISIQSLSGDSTFTPGSGATLTITENESAPEVELILSSGSSSPITENAGSSLTLIASINQVSDEDISVVIATSGTATEGTDYSSISDVTISAGDMSTTATFTPIDDSIYEGDETATISIDSVSGSDATTDGTQSVTITITENESAPTLTLTSSASSIAENGSALTLTATLSTATSEDVTVSLAVSGTATSGTDYNALSDMTITSGQTTTTASFSPSDDNVYEGDETAIIDVDSVSGGSATESGTQQLTLTISDNESAPTVTLTSSASSVSEDGSALTLTATLTNATTADVTITLSAGGTATEGTDYANLSDITVTAGDTTGTTSLTPTDDSTFEGDETITVDIDSVSGGSATENGTQQVSITFQEDDAGPTLTISDVTTSDESAANASVTVTLSPASGLSATVDYATSDGTATAGSDYTSTSGTLTFAAGDTTKTISVPILADTTDENDETITVTLSNAVRSTIDDSTATITITDDDSAPSLSINDVTTTNETAGNATFTVSLSAASGKEITVAYATSDGTATAGSDYTSSSGTLTFAAGDTTKTFTVPVLGDSTDENNETVTLTLSSASNASISDSNGTLTITDDDDAPSLSINDVSSSDESNTSTSLTVSLSAASEKDITVDYASSNGTATAGSDYTAASGTLTFSAGDTTKTIDITTLADSVVEGNETVTITLSSANNASISDSTGTFTITDDDTSAFSVADVTAAEDASTATITVTATNAFSSDVTIDYATSNGTATAGSDYTAASGTLTLSAGDTTKTFTVTISDDSTDENNETATITISNASSGSISDATATLTITDNDNAPSLSINDVSSSDEGDGATNMTVSLSAASGKEVTVDYASSDVTAEAGSDYTAASGTLTFSAGDTTKTIAVTVADDTIYEGDETLTMTLSNPSNASISDATGTFTITDDDNAPTVTLSTSASNIAENAGTSLTLTATLSNATTEDVTVALGTSGTATEGTDYSNVSDITITAGSTTGTASFTPTDDSTYESSTDETSTIAITSVSGGGASESGTQSVTITINENDSAPTVTLSTSNTTIAENSSSTLTLTATLSNPTYQDVTVSIGTSGTATEGTDYANISDITISAGDTTGTAIFNPTDDSDETDTVTATVAITGVSGGEASESGTQSVTISITDDESVPRVSLSVNNTSIAEDAGSSLTLTATLSKTASEDVTVTLSTSGAATEGTDYGSLSNITVTAGQTTGTVSFTPTDDSIYDATSNETATVAIDSVSGGSALENGDQSVTITITDDESAPTVTLSRASSSIDEDSSSTVTLTATLSDATYQDVTVTLAASGGTEGTDYENVSNITVSAGSTTGTSSIDPIDDSVYEGDEIVTISIDGVSGGGASESGTQSTTVTISENESAPTVSLSVDSTTIAENAGSSLTLTATLSGTTDADIIVALDTSGTATEVTDYTDGSGAIDDITISSGQATGTVSFTPTDDSIYDATSNETATIAINGVSGKTGVAENSSPQEVTITISDNESAPTVTLSAASSSIAENSGSTITLTATLSNATYEDVTVLIDGTGGSGTEGTDFAEVSNITVSGGSTTGTTAFDPSDDSIYEGDETGVIAISSVSGGSASESGDQSETITISENESAPVITIASSASSVYDNGDDLTLTATSTVAADEDITVTLSTSGTASSSSDYSLSSSTITIAANSTSGTATFNPTADTSNEGAETATISIAVSGADSSTGTPSSVTITINEYALRTETAFADDPNDNVTSSSIASLTGYNNMDTSTARLGTTRVHSYTQMRINEVIPYTDGTNYLTGEGQTIHIADFNCNTNMDVFDSSNKTIYNLDDGGSGESTFQNDTSSNYHCNAVVALAAGLDSGGADTIPWYGVAWNADLVLSSIPDYEGDYASDDYAADLDSARGYGAIVSNNSWGFTDSGGSSTVDATEFQNFYDTYKNSYSLDQLAGVYFSGNALVPDAQTNDFQTYVTALDNFQNSGVIVFANGNFNTDNDASWIASLPVWYNGTTDALGNSLEDLSDAWLSVNYADFTGSDMVGITESEFTLKGNPCGKAREFCLTVDDFGLNTPSWYDETTGANNYAIGTGGSSWGAPMVSGGIALLKQAFPNHTPEQLVDRVLASANNSWFTPVGNTTFTSHGNSITHGYHNTWGHGLPDFKAALSPITTNANPASFMLSATIAEGYSNPSLSLGVEGTSIIASSAMGDSLSRGLSANTAYFYDAMGGGFEYDLSSSLQTKPISLSSKQFNISQEQYNLNSMDSLSFKQLPQTYAGEYFSFKNDQDLGLSVTINQPSVAAQKFNIFESGNYQDDSLLNLRGLGINNTSRVNNSEVTLSYLDSSLDPAIYSSPGDVDHSSSMLASINFTPDLEKRNLILTLGAVEEQDSLLLNKGNSGLGLGEGASSSNIVGLNISENLTNNSSLSFNALFSQTQGKNINNSLITGTSDIITSKFDINYEVLDYFSSDEKIILTFAQPVRVEQGSMKLRLPGLADSEGNIPHENTSMSLSPSSRQIDLSLGYYKSLGESTSIGFKGIVNQNKNHSIDGGTEMSFGTTFNYLF